MKGPEPVSWPIPLRSPPSSPTLALSLLPPAKKNAKGAPLVWRAEHRSYPHLQVTTLFLCEFWVKWAVFFLAENEVS